MANKQKAVYRMKMEKARLTEEELEKISGGMYVEYYPEDRFCPESEDNEHEWHYSEVAEDYSIVMKCKFCGATVNGTLHFGSV